MKGLMLIALSLTALLPGVASAREYKSPDGALSASVDNSSSNCEAVLIFRSHGKEILNHSYRSKDHEHGSCVGMAKWTPDSQFFVFSLQSSGGHQPWHAPIDFFSRRTNSVDSIEHYIADPVTEEEFSVSQPDVVELTTTKIPTDENIPVQRSVALSKINR